MLEYHINQNLPRRYAQWPPSRHFISFPSAASFERMRLAVAGEAPQSCRTSAFWMTSWCSKNCSICFQRSAALSFGASLIPSLISTASMSDALIAESQSVKVSRHISDHSIGQFKWRIFDHIAPLFLLKNSARTFLFELSHDSRIWPVSPHPRGYRQISGSPACQCSPGTGGSR